MDQQTDKQDSRSTEGRQVTWSDKTRGGYWVRNIEPCNSDGYGYVLRGEVGNHCSELPSDDPSDWAWETWRSDGRYMISNESSMDLM